MILDVSCDQAATHYFATSKVMQNNRLEQTISDTLPQVFNGEHRYIIATHYCDKTKMKPSRYILNWTQLIYNLVTIPFLVQVAGRS